MTTWREDLVSSLGDAVELDAPLAPRVSFRIGGPADAFVRPRTAAALARVLTIAHEHGVPVTLLGSGTNVLVSDGGIRGITLRLAGELAAIEVQDDGAGLVRAGAGALNATIVARALDHGLTGIEFLATIPGTFGGALVMNAGAHGGEIGPFVREVALLDRDLRQVTRTGSECGFAYRRSGFVPGEIITSALLALPAGDVEAARAHLREMRDRRRATQPLDEPNAGSIFKNPPGAYAGKLIEACGLKGRRAGRARISELHANFIVNEGGATAADVVELASSAQAAVRDRFGVDLEWEVKRIGD